VITIAGTIHWFCSAPQPSFSCVSLHVDFCEFLPYPSAFSDNKVMIETATEYEMDWRFLKAEIDLPRYEVTCRETSKHSISLDLRLSNPLFGIA